jgi:hypothetical protein
MAPRRNFFKAQLHNGRGKKGKADPKIVSGHASGNSGRSAAASVGRSIVWADVLSSKTPPPPPSAPRSFDKILKKGRKGFIFTTRGDRNEREER